MKDKGKKEPDGGFDQTQSVKYTIDAKKQGGIARFINHSCDPNLKIVTLFWDHKDISKPHINFFATKDILPYEELCFNYQYEISEGWISSSCLDSFLISRRHARIRPDQMPLRGR